MRQKLLSGRPVVTRTSRFDPHGAKLESVAAEFALLAQRRARTARQVDLLARQLDTATAGLDGVQARMMLLAQRMQQIDPELARTLQVEVASLPKIVENPPPSSPIRGMYHLTQRDTRAPHEIAQQTAVSAPQAVSARPMRQWPRRRPFLPE